MTPTPPTGLRIQIVEDEFLIAAELSDRLTRLGYQVVAEADTGERAVAAAERTNPDLIFMDVRLKGPMDGIQAAELIQRRHSIPVIFLTAHSDGDTLQRAKRTDPFGYVLKPFHERDLVVAIEMAVHRHQAEMKLKESEQRYSTILGSIGDAVIATDPIGRVTYLNRVAEALTGWDDLEAKGRPVEQVLPVLVEATGAVRENPALQALRTKQRIELTEPVLLLRKDRQYVPIDDSAAPILDDRGRVLGAVVAFRDIRQRRLTESALREAEAQLRQAQKMEAIGRLAGGVAHDFNNLLTVINGYSDILLDAQLDETTTALLREIKRAGERSADLTRQLLAFSRKQMLRPAVVGLNALVGDILRLVERLIGEDVILSSAFAAALWPVRVDPGQLEQIVMNLAVNARDAMPQGGKLHLETSNVDVKADTFPKLPEILPGRYVLLAVTDTGVGMDPATQEQIFEPFFTTKELGKGTGLGLATVYGIVKQSDGFVYVQSEVGRGTAFRIYLPAAEEPPRPTTNPAALAAAAGTETLLLVEDEEAVRALTSSALRMQGYTVLTAEDGAAALARFAEAADAIQMIVSDVVMPGMSGREVVENVRAQKPGVKVLFLSGYTDDAVVRHGVQLGETTFLQKPFTLAALAKKVREVLDS